MTVVPFEPFHIELLRAQGVQDAQLTEVSYVPASCAKFLKPAGPCVTAFQGATVLVCGGIMTASPGTGVAWALLSNEAARHMLWLHRAVLRFIETQRLRRLEATVVEGFPAGCRWVELLGFEFEGRMRAYGPDGETHLRYARVT